MISLYNPEAPYPVYCQDCWWSDSWDPLAYGTTVDFSRPFFEQYRELQLVVPRLALFNIHSENSIYTNHSSNNKNCYMGVAFGDCEDCLYGHWVLHSRNVVDGLYLEHCEHCYECSYCQHCYQAYWCVHCAQVRDSLLCYECRNCEYCIGCVQLQHKRYQVLNESVSKAAFDSFRREILTSREKFAEVYQAYRRLKLTRPHRATLQINCENCMGDDLYNSRNSMHCFNCRELDDCRYMYDLGNNKSSMDCYEHGWLVQSELIYESHAGMAGYRFIGCNTCADSNHLMYSDLCFNNCAHLFGCIGLKKKEHCILNREYSEREYETLVAQLIERMTTDHEWGEFFPGKYSPFGYNESVASEYHPLTEKVAIEQGFSYSTWHPAEPHPSEILDAEQLPTDIANASDKLLQSAIRCRVSKKPYRITKQELAFYRTHQLPPPEKHPDVRHAERMRLRNPRTFSDRRCEKCGKEITSTFSLQANEIVYCDDCYRSEIY